MQGLSGKYVEEKKLRVVLVSKQDSPTAEHKSKELAKEPSNETSVKQENVVKKDDNVPPVENKVEDPVEVKAALTTEDPKPS
nr:vesicle-associated protein 2-2-like [Tanacetum cinerariifolium]